MGEHASTLQQVLGGPGGFGDLKSRRAPGLSLREPWLWLVLQGWKPIENRKWATRYRGQIFLHRAKGLPRRYYDDAATFCADNLELDLPSFAFFKDLERPGFAGVARIAGCQANDALLDVLKLGPPASRAAALAEPDRWRMRGQYGFALADVRELELVKCNGALGLFPIPDGAYTELLQRTQVRP